MRFAGQVALVTGAAAGIGAATARRFAAEGASVVLVDLNIAGASGVAAEIAESGGLAEPLEADVSRTVDVEAMVAFACRRYGRLDVLHNNAVAVLRGGVHELELNEWRRSLEVGLTAYWYATKIALGQMIEQGGGVIVNTASISGLAADPGLSAYNAAKAGVINLTRSTAIEQAPNGIRCNAVCPGPIRTRALVRMAERHPEVIEAVERAVPAGRLGLPEEVAAAVAYLASSDASFVNGTTLVVDGGMTAHTTLPPLAW